MDIDKKAAFEGKKILIIDDDINLCQMIEVTFAIEGAFAFTANDGREGLQAFFAHRPDLVILDINMPEMNGWEVCRQIRLLASTPVILLTTLNNDESIVKGLDYGADDFITKPFSVDVLLARARAVLRRAQLARADSSLQGYHDDYLTIDIPKRLVIANGEQVRLTATEFQLLTYLVSNAGRVLSYTQILDQVWGWEYRDSVDYVHVYVSHLRRKIEKDPKNPIYLLTEYGTGYRFQRAV